MKPKKARKAQKTYRQCCVCDGPVGNVSFTVCGHCYTTAKERKTMNANEQKLREALEHVRDTMRRWNTDTWDKNADEIDKVLKQTAHEPPEPPKHPAVLTYQKVRDSRPLARVPDYPSYMQGFKDALLWAASYDNADGPAFRDFLKHSANTVPL